MVAFNRLECFRPEYLDRINLVLFIEQMLQHPRLLPNKEALIQLCHLEQILTYLPHLPVLIIPRHHVASQVHYLLLDNILLLLTETLDQAPQCLLGQSGEPVYKLLQ